MEASVPKELYKLGGASLPSGKKEGAETKAQGPQSDRRSFLQLAGVPRATSLERGRSEVDQPF